MTVDIRRNKDGTFSFHVDDWSGRRNTIEEVLQEVERIERQTRGEEQE